MNFKQLSYIITIAEEQSFTAAAAKHFVSQPSLSLCVHNIEEELGTTLFDRSTSPISLTKAGEVYVEWAKTVVMTKQQTELQIQDIVVEKRTNLRIGASLERIRTLVAPVMYKFSKLRPYCHIDIFEDQNARIQLMLENGDIDLALSTNNENAILYSSIPIYDEIPVLAVPVQYCKGIDLPGGECPSINLEIFKSIPYISLSAEQTYGSYFRLCCAKSGFVPDIRVVCRMLNCLHDLVIEGVGAGLVTTAFYKRHHDYEHVRYFYLNDLPAQRTIYLLYRNGYYLSEDAKTLITLMQEHHA